MKNQRGFGGVGVLIAMLVGLAVLGGGAYYVAQQSVAQTPADNFDNMLTPPPNDYAPQRVEQVNSRRDFVRGALGIRKINAPATVSLAPSQTAEVRNKWFFFTLDSLQSSTATISVSEINCAIQFPSDPPPTGPVCSMMPPPPKPVTLRPGESVVSGVTTVTLTGVSAGSATFQVSSPSALGASPPSGPAPLDVDFTASLDYMDVLRYYAIDFGDGSPVATDVNGLLAPGDKCGTIAVLPGNQESRVCMNFRVSHRYGSTGTYQATLTKTANKCIPSPGAACERQVIGQVLITVFGSNPN